MEWTWWQIVLYALVYLLTGVALALRGRIAENAPSGNVFWAHIWVLGTIVGWPILVVSWVVFMLWCAFTSTCDFLLSRWWKFLQMCGYNPVRFR